MRKLDAIDRELLRLLQLDADTPVAQLAEAVNLSPTPCWRRVQRLKDEGVITRRAALLDRSRLNLGVTVFVAVRTNQHSEAWFRKFHAAVSQVPEVLEFYRMAGDVDYMLRVAVASIQDYDAFYKKLIAAIPLKNVTSRFAMERIKQTTALPIA